MKDYKREIAAYLDEVKERDCYRLDEVISDIKQAKKVCVFGIGAISFPIIAALRDIAAIRVDFLCDNDSTKWGNIYQENMPCISPEELETYGQEVAIVVTTQHYKAIYEQLKKNPRILK
jgi:hypothetical protein